MLDEIRKRLKAATPGPWTSDLRNGCMAVYAGPHRNCLAGVESEVIRYKHGYQRPDDSGWTTTPQDEADNDFIAHAPEDIAKLLNLVDRARIIFDLAIADCNSQGWDENPEWMTNAEKWLEDANNAKT